jgi:glycosyltransferase involved in cell wall biosynthesis
MSDIPGKRLIVFAFGISPPGSMGGNSKIALELIRAHSRQHQVVVLSSDDKRPTFERNIELTEGLRLHTVPTFRGNRMLHPIREAMHYARLAKPVLAAVGANENDVVYSCSDFLLDVLPAFLLKPAFRFVWAPSLFLFVPFITENVRHQYGFPVLKYALYYVYQRSIFRLIKMRGDLFVITSDCDRRHFPKRLQPHVFAFYGGVNVEQIQVAESVARPDPDRRRDVVFCGRLHPQKGIDAFLDVWRRVLDALPDARLTVIGNGTAGYERMLKRKADRLGIAARVDWLGYVNNEEKYAVYLSARVFVHPTVYDNNGMVAAEALCSGLPVVMYDLPNLRSVYSVGCTKVRERDGAAFAAALIRLLSDPAACASDRPSSGAVQELRNHWSWQTRVRRFEEFLESQVPVVAEGQAVSGRACP